MFSNTLRFSGYSAVTLVSLQEYSVMESVVLAMEAVQAEEVRPHPEWPNMKLFQVTKKNLAAVGISQNLTIQPWAWLNARILMGFLVLGSASLCTFAYTTCEAETFAEFTQSIYVGSTVILISLALLNLLVNTRTMFELFDGFESLANTSERKSDKCK